MLDKRRKICDNHVNWKFLVTFQIIKFIASFNRNKQIVNVMVIDRSVTLRDYAIYFARRTNYSGELTELRSYPESKCVFYH